MDHFADPRNVGALPDADIVGTAGEPGRGNYIVLYFKLDGEVIVECGFETFGCAPAIAAGSMVTELMKGRSVAEALKLTPEELESALGGLPLGRRHCAGLAVEALREGLLRE
jgi:nitrogen fixation NifU-like protein